MRASATRVRLAVRHRLGRGTDGESGTDGERGNAMVEFLYLAVLLMVPLVYVLITVFRVQAASYAVSSAAREAGRVFATAETVEGAEARAFAAASIVMADSGLDLRPRQLELRCPPLRCLRPGSQVNVVVTYQVALPLVPRLFDDRAPATVRVTSRHLEVVDEYRTGPR